MSAASSSSNSDVQLEDYISAFNAHVEDSWQHVLGRSDPYDRDHKGRVIQSSRVPPTLTLWTPKEKYAFFAALSRHSRYRTDLIASDIGTKSEAEVLWYLQTLVAGVSDARRAHRGHDKTKLDHRKVWRPGFAPSAREISEDAIREEERLAQQARDLADNLDGTPRERRQRREAAFKTVAKEMRQGPQPEGKPSVSQMREELKALVEGRCDAEEWLEHLDHEKLDLLDGQLASEWSEWYKSRSGKGGAFDLEAQFRAANGDAVVWEQPESGLESAHLSPDAANSSRRTYKHDPKKMGRMAAEAARLQFLSDIPARERTAEQEAEVAKLFNKQRARERYRTKVLIAEGLSEQDINRCGGADKVFASRAIIKTPAEPPEPSSALSSAIPAHDEALQAIVSRHKLDVVDSADIAIERGWELLHLGRLAEFVRKFDVDPSATEINGTVLDELVLLLNAFITPLIHAAITIAEARSDSRFITSEQANDIHEDLSGGVHAQDVHQALATRETSYPGAKLTQSLLDIGVKDLEVRRPIHFGLNNLPPGDLAWSQMSCITHPSGFHDAMSATHLVSAIDHRLLPEISLDSKRGSADELEEEDYVMDEDERVDKALNKLDTAYDRLLIDWPRDRILQSQSMKRKRPPQEGDLTNPWSCALDGSESERVTAALNARQGYEAVLRKIAKDRRRRIGIQLRTKRMNLAELRREAKHRALLASDWIVFDEDGEDEEDEEDDAPDEGDEGSDSEDGQSAAEESGSEESEQDRDGTYSSDEQ